MSLRMPYLGVCLLTLAFLAGGAPSFALTPTPTPTLPPVEILLPPSSASASTTDGNNVAANAVDNNLGTRWSGFGNGATLRFNLFGLPRVISHVKVAVYEGNRR